MSVVFSSRVTPKEREEISCWLTPGELDVFVAQPGYDQRHGLDAARYVSQLQPARHDLIRAALLHDVGKRHAALGPIGRSFASAYSKLGGKPKGRWALYLDHGSVGSKELRTLSVEQTVADFAEYHHGQRPASIVATDWALLQAADGIGAKVDQLPGRRESGGR